MFRLVLLLFLAVPTCIDAFVNIQALQPVHYSHPRRMGARHARYMPPEFLGARGTWPRPRCDCPSCGNELSLAWGNHRGPYMRHLPSKNSTTGCRGGESIEHQWAKQAFASVLEQNCTVHFERTCSECGQNRRVGTVAAKTPDDIVYTEYRLDSDKIADVAVVRKKQIMGLVEIFHTHRTESASSSADARPEPWFEVKSTAVFRMLNSTSSDSEIRQLECVRQDAMQCNECRQMREYWTRRGNERKLLFGKHKGKTFMQVKQDDPKYCRWALEELMRPTFLNLPVSKRDGVFFKRPKGAYVYATAFLEPPAGLLRLFCIWLINDPDMRGVEIRNITLSNADEDIWESIRSGYEAAEDYQFQVVRAYPKYRNQGSKAAVKMCMSQLNIQPEAREIVRKRSLEQLRY